MNSYSSALASLPTSSSASAHFPAHPRFTNNRLSTPFDKPVVPQDTAVIIIGSEHTQFYPQQHKLFINTADAVVVAKDLEQENPIFNIEVLRAAQRLSKSQQHLRIMINDSSAAAQILYNRLQALIH